MNTTDIIHILEKIHDIETELHRLKSLVLNIQKTKSTQEKKGIVSIDPPKRKNTHKPSQLPSKGPIIVPTNNASEGK